MKHKIIIRLLLTLLINAYNSAQNTPITIFIHGTRTLSKLFIKYSNKNDKIVNIKEISKNHITKSISQALDSSDAQNYSKEFFYVFGWSGKLSHQARLQAAKILLNELLNLINSLKKLNINPVINLITHSHGGNVALNLANVVQNDNIVIKNLILLACPVQEQTKHLVNHNIFENIYNIYSTLDLLQILDPQRLHRENKNKKIPFFSQRIFSCCNKLKQAKLKINNCGVTHIGFLKRKFFKQLPQLINKMKTLNSNKITLIKL